MLSESSHGRIWQQARARALTPAQVVSPLAARPYDLRHGGVTLSLNAGVPPTMLPLVMSHFCWWWQVQGSNLGRRSRRFYSETAAS
jgi:hypothetical protein